MMDWHYQEEESTEHLVTEKKVYIGIEKRNIQTRINDHKRCIHDLKNKIFFQHKKLLSSDKHGEHLDLQIKQYLEKMEDNHQSRFWYSKFSI